jgi:hypothetical protein
MMLSNWLTSGFVSSACADEDNALACLQEALSRLANAGNDAAADAVLRTL